MSVTATGADKRLDIGGVAEDAFGVLKRRGKDLLLASLLLVVLPNYLSLGVRFAAHSTTSFGIATLAPGLVVWVLSLAFQGGLFYATTRDLDGKSASLEDMLRVGFKACLPMLGLTLLVFIPMELGFVLLVVPGVLVLLRWCVAGPAMVAENLGVFASMKRSAELTKGRRWSIFLTFLVIVLFFGILYALFIALAGGLNGVVALTSMQDITPFSLLLLVLVSPVLGIVLSIGLNVFLGALFHRLRGGREGAASAALAEVFA
jgi:hypothetical protein